RLGRGLLEAHGEQDLGRRRLAVARRGPKAPAARRGRRSLREGRRAAAGLHVRDLSLGGDHEFEHDLTGPARPLRVIDGGRERLGRYDGGGGNTLRRALLRLRRGTSGVGEGDQEDTQTPA